MLRWLFVTLLYALLVGAVLAACMGGLMLVVDHSFRQVAASPQPGLAHGQAHAKAAAPGTMLPRPLVVGITKWGFLVGLLVGVMWRIEAAIIRHRRRQLWREHAEWERAQGTGKTRRGPDGTA